MKIVYVIVYEQDVFRLQLHIRNKLFHDRRFGRKGNSREDKLIPEPKSDKPFLYAVEIVFRADCRDYSVAV